MGEGGVAGLCFVKVTHPLGSGRDPGQPLCSALSKGVLGQVCAVGWGRPRQGGVWKWTLPSESRSALGMTQAAFGRDGGSSVASRGRLPWAPVCWSGRRLVLGPSSLPPGFVCTPQSLCLHISVVTWSSLVKAERRGMAVCWRRNDEVSQALSQRPLCWRGSCLLTCSGCPTSRIILDQLWEL